MSGETTIAVVTIVCTCIVTITQLIVRSNVIELSKTVKAQTIELAGLHQTVIAQNARITEMQAEKTMVAYEAGRRDRKLPPGLS